MAAGENQPQPVVVHALLVVSAGVARGGLEAFGDLAERGVEPGALAHGGDRFESAGRDQPGARVGGEAIARPLFDGGGERVVHRLLGEIEIAEQADQGGEHAAGIGPVDGVHRRPHLFDRVLAPQLDPDAIS